MSLTARKEYELKQKAKQTLKTSEDPIEILRAKCLARGADGIRGLARFLIIIKSSKNKHESNSIINSGYI